MYFCIIPGRCSIMKITKNPPETCFHCVIQPGEHQVCIHSARATLLLWGDAEAIQANCCSSEQNLMIQAKLILISRHRGSVMLHTCLKIEKLSGDPVGVGALTVPLGKDGQIQALQAFQTTDWVTKPETERHELTGTVCPILYWPLQSLYLIHEVIFVL